jgi:hypothetical protein
MPLFFEACTTLARRTEPISATEASVIGLEVTVDIFHARESRITGKSNWQDLLHSILKNRHPDWKFMDPSFGSALRSTLNSNSLTNGLTRNPQYYVEETIFRVCSERLSPQVFSLSDATRGRG